MAQPIPLEVPPRDARTELQARLENAPVEDAEALLDAYELLRVLRDRRIFDALRGALGAGAKLAETAARAAESPQSLTALRNVIILAKTVASIDPELLRCISMAVSETMSSKEETATDSPSMLALLSQFRSKELRRSVGLINRFLNSLGKQLKSRGVAQG
jgi:uncharacterized protein YjgD (DUF1641 family)